MIFPVMNISRMRHLITVLQSVPADRLSLESWACGTQYCAIGHASQDPTFNAQGFILEQSSHIVLSYLIQPVYIEDGARYESWDAVQKFFGLNPVQADYLFSQENYENKATPQDVIDRLNAAIEVVEEEIFQCNAITVA